MDHDSIIKDYKEKLLNILYEKIVGPPRTYGFEYELLPEHPLSLEHMDKLYNFLPECSFNKDGKYFRHPNGMYITFEPGGQIEYHSTPLLPGDTESYNKNINEFKDINKRIKEKLGINYIATGYIPGRSDAVLCLTDKRYKNLHARLGNCGTRGHEMMKGTASIHLHASICSIEEIPVLFKFMCSLSVNKDFKMSDERRDIWDNTDPCRCGLPFKNINNYSSPWQVIEELVRHAYGADHIDYNIPFSDLKDKTFDAFMYHMTTMFTDVRINRSAPTIELRTLDSVPLDDFEVKLNRFISLVEGMKYNTGGKIQ